MTCDMDSDSSGPGIPVNLLGGIAILANVHYMLHIDRLTTTKPAIIAYMTHYTYEGILPSLQGITVTGYMIIL